MSHHKPPAAFNKDLTELLEKVYLRGQLDLIKSLKETAAVDLPPDKSAVAAALRDIFTEIEDAVLKEQAKRFTDSPGN